MFLQTNTCAKLREFYCFLSEQSGFLLLKIKKGIFYITTALILDQLEHLECTALSNLSFLCECLYLGSTYEGRGLAERGVIIELGGQLARRVSRHRGYNERSKKKGNVILFFTNFNYAPTC